MSETHKTWEESLEATFEPLDCLCDINDLLHFHLTLLNANAVIVLNDIRCSQSCSQKVAMRSDYPHYQIYRDRWCKTRKDRLIDTFSKWDTVFVTDLIFIFRCFFLFVFIPPPSISKWMDGYLSTCFNKTNTTKTCLCHQLAVSFSFILMQFQWLSSNLKYATSYTDLLLEMLFTDIL